MKMRAKLYLITALLLFSIVLTNSMKADETTILAIDPVALEVPEVQIGEEIQLNITIANVVDLWGWKARLNWNPQVLNLTQIQEGPFLRSKGSTLFIWPYRSPTIKEGYIQELSCVLLQPTGANANGILCTLTYKVLSSGASTILMNETQLLTSGSTHKEIPHITVNGEITAIPEFTSAVVPTLFMISAIFLMAISRRTKLDS